MNPTSYKTFNKTAFIPVGGKCLISSSDLTISFYLEKGNDKGLIDLKIVSPSLTSLWILKDKQLSEVPLDEEGGASLRIDYSNQIELIKLVYKNAGNVYLSCQYCYSR